MQPLPHHGVVAVTGYDEATDVYRDVDTFSSCNSVIGPFATFPVPLEGDDVSAIIDRYRDQLPMHEHMVTMDPPMHTQERAILMRLITPKRLKDNEEFMWRLADRQLGEFVDDGRCEFISAYTQPFAMLVVADLLGVPEEDHERFREFFGLSRNPGEIGAGADHDMELNVLGWLDDRFVQYIEDRRREPRARRAHAPRARDVPRRDARPTSSTSCGPPPSCSPPVRRRPRACSPPRSKHLAVHPELQDELRAQPRPHPELPRRDAPHREPGEGRLPPRPPRHERRRRRHRGGHARDAAERRGQP